MQAYFVRMEIRKKISWPYLCIKLYIQDFEAVAEILLKTQIAYGIKLYVWVNNSANFHGSWCCPSRT